MSDCLDEWSCTAEMKKQLNRFPVTHNTTALAYYPQRHIVNNYYGRSEYNSIPLFDRCLAVINEINLKEGGGRSLRVIDDPTRVYMSAFNSTNGKELAMSSTNKLLRAAFMVSLQEVSKDYKHIAAEHPGCPNVGNLASLKVVEQERIVSELSACFSNWRIACRVRDAIQRKHYERLGGSLRIPIKFFNFKVYTNNEILFFVDQSGDKDIILLNYEQVLMVVDTLACRTMCRLACLINDETKLDDLPSHDLLCKVYQWGDSLIEQYGQPGYAVIGEYESIITNAFVNFPGSDPLKLGEGFFESLTETAQEISETYGVDPSWLSSIMGLLRDVTSPNVLSELFGLQKHWGNPMTDAKASGRAVQERLAERIPLDPVAMMSLLASFNRMITLEFMKKNGRWPECEFADHASGTPLYAAWKLGAIRIDESVSGHKHLHWAMMKFGCNCVFDEYHDQVSFLNDKSVSLYRNHLDALYARAMHPPAKDITIDEERRLLLEFLRREHLTIVDIFRTVMRDEVPKEWLCNSASMKGNEMKYLKARIFAVLPYELRQYFSITEDAIKDHVFRYNPHQTMTMKEGDLLVRLKSVTEQLCVKGSGRELNVIHIVDFSKWNLRMRYENTTWVFKSIDDFMGTPGLIEASHPIFSDMVNVVQDAFNPPGCPVEEAETDTIWRQHDSGWEGQRQKGWTAVTSAVLSYIELLTGVHSVICGQGDNQVLLSKFAVPKEFLSAQDWIERDPDGVRVVLDSFYATLEEECNKIGLKVKTAETCRSLSYLNYGKRLFFNGVELSMCLKRISKMMTEPNESFPTTEAKMKTLEGSIYASGMYSHPGPLHYLIGRVGTYIALYDAFYHNTLIRDEPKKMALTEGIIVDHVFLSALMKIPASVGGPPQLSLASYFARGHPDPLTTDLVIPLIRARQGDVFARKLLTCIIKEDWYDSNRSTIETLIHAPYSLNLGTPRSATKPLERVVASAVRSYCRNPDIKELFNENVERLGAQLVAALTSMEPFHPIIANDIYGRSLSGRQKSFLTGFSNATSMSRLATETGDRPIVWKVKELELAQLGHWVKIYKKIKGTNADRDVVNMRDHELSNKCRLSSWGMSLEGVTVPHPLDQFVMVRDDSDTCAGCEGLEDEHIVFAIHSEKLISIPGRSTPFVALTRSQGATPYLGSVVSEGIISVDVHCDNPSSSWNDVRRLAIMRKWLTSPGEELYDILTEIIRSRTDISEDIITRAAGNPGRLAFNHRLASMSVKKSCAPVCTTNVFSRIYISSNRMGEFSHGDVNYHMPFGPAFVVLQTLLSLHMVGSRWDYVTEGETRQVFHAHARSRNVPVVYDGKLCTASSERDAWPLAPNLLFASSSHLLFSDLAGVFVRGIWSKIEDAPLEHCKLMYGNQLIANNLVNELVSHELMSVEGRQSYPSRQSLVSIGDIAIVGVPTFIRAVSYNLLMVLPYSVLCSHDEVAFGASVLSFLDKLSSSFWSNFTVPLSSKKHILRVMRDQVGFESTATARYSGVEEPLKAAIAKELCIVWKRFCDHIVYGRKMSPFIIAAPSVAASKALISRFFEVCICCLYQTGYVSYKQVVYTAREMSASVHKADENTLGLVVMYCYKEFSEKSARLISGSGKFAPHLVLYSLRDVWVDRIRGLEEQEQMLPRCLGGPRPRPLVVRASSFSVPVHSPVYDDSVCECAVLTTAPSYRTIHYYLPRGCTGKLPSTFMEVIAGFELNVSGVVVLGSALGSEAACISLMNDNEWVYSHHSGPLTDFSPHQAGSYVPPAFLVEGCLNKLINDDRSAVRTNSLDAHDTYTHIVSQLRGRRPSGFIITPPLPFLSSNGHVSNLMMRIKEFVRHFPTSEWLLLRVCLPCGHMARRVLSFLSLEYQTVRLVYPMLTKERSNIFHVLCQNMRQDPLGLDLLGPSCSRTFSAFHSDSDLEQRIGDQLTSRYPRIFLAEPNQIRSVMSVTKHMVHSLPIAVSQLVRGCYVSEFEKPSKSKFMSLLELLEESFKQEVIDMVRTTVKQRMGERLVRTAVLQISDKRVRHDIDICLRKIFNCTVLRHMIGLETTSLDDLVTQLDKLLEAPMEIIIDGTPHVCHPSQEEFIRVCSGPLFEILGHLNQWRVLTTESSSVRLYHRLSAQPQTREECFPSLLLLQCQAMIGVPDLAWENKYRAFLMSLLLVKVFNCNSEAVVVDSPFNHTLLSSTREMLGMEWLHTARASVEYSVFLWTDDINAYTGDIRQVKWICLPQEQIGKVPVQCEEMYAVPWSGMVPSRVFVHVDANITTIKARTVFPHIYDLPRRTNKAGQALHGCECWCCAGEAVLCLMTGTSNQVISTLAARVSTSDTFTKWLTLEK